MCCKAVVSHHQSEQFNNVPFSPIFKPSFCSNAINRQYVTSRSDISQETHVVLRDVIWDCETEYKNIILFSLLVLQFPDTYMVLKVLGKVLEFRSS